MSLSPFIMLTNPNTNASIMIDPYNYVSTH